MEGSVFSKPVKNPYEGTNTFLDDLQICRFHFRFTGLAKLNLCSFSVAHELIHTLECFLTGITSKLDVSYVPCMGFPTRIPKFAFVFFVKGAFFILAMLVPSMIFQIPT